MGFLSCCVGLFLSTLFLNIKYVKRRGQGIELYKYPLIGFYIMNIMNEHDGEHFLSCLASHRPNLR